MPVSSEAEAVSIGAGAALGGKQVMIYMEGTRLVCLHVQSYCGGKAVWHTHAAGFDLPWGLFGPA